jgi:hypothetical protein
MWPYLAPIADLLMIAASAGAGIYCLVLSRRLSRLTSFDKGIGGAIAVLSAQVDDMKQALSDAKTGSDSASAQLQDLVRQARDISGELELMVAACHDFAEEALVAQSNEPPIAAPDQPPVSPPPAAQSEVTAEPIPIFGTRRQLATGPEFAHKVSG